MGTVPFKAVGCAPRTYGAERTRKGRQRENGQEWVAGGKASLSPGPKPEPQDISRKISGIEVDILSFRRVRYTNTLFLVQRYASGCFSSHRSALGLEG